MQKVVVITGASAGIGAALARELSAGGHRLVLAARRREELEKIARETGESLPVPTDVTRREEVERLRDRAIEEFGHIDVWINNAGRGISKPVLQLTDADVDEMMTVNVKSALYGMQAVVPHFMERRAGHLINVSSFLGRVPMASIRSVYSAAKAALNSLTANLRTDLAAEYSDIHISLVMPGLVKTEFARNALGSSAAPAAPPAGPPPGSMQPQTAEEVADAIAGLIERPEAEIYTNPASPELVRRYYADVGAFEAQILAKAP
jgi:NADP-dependent 3-hydroxy acid dehydrogenase YdfG